MGSYRKNKAVPSHQSKSSSSSPNSSIHNPPDNAHEFGNGNGHGSGNRNGARNGFESSLSANDGYANDEEEEEIDCNPQSLDFSQVLQDVEGSLVGTMTSGVMAISQLFNSSPSPAGSSPSFRVSWKELMYLLLAIFILAGLSILLGVSAGITISIHYFDTHANPSFLRLEARERDLGPHQRVTTLDFSIVSSNILQHPSVGTPTSSTSSSDAHVLTLGRAITMSESGQRNVLFVVEETQPVGRDDNRTRGENTFPDGAVISDEIEIAKLAMFNGNYKPYRQHGPPDSRFQVSASKVHPTICSDGVTIGYEDWSTLKAAVEEANALSAERFMKWNEYYASLDKSGGSPTSSPVNANQHDHPHEKASSPYDEDFLRQYYDDDIVFRICPGSKLKAAKGPIFFNAENIVIECGDHEEALQHIHGNRGASASASSRSSTTSASFVTREMPSCVIDVGGSHLAFGPHAKNILVRRLGFQSATASSLAFHHNGAQASFEDCVWKDNAGTHGEKYGAVADVNSNSSLNFYRCEIGSNLGSLNVATPAAGAGARSTGTTGTRASGKHAATPSQNAAPSTAPFSLR